jgi:two-component system nitrate/nitrite response regulator NarL
MAASMTSASDHLTPAEERVLAVLGQTGGSNAEIARALGVAKATVKVHVESILRKLGVDNRTKAALWWREQRWWPHPPES